MKSIEIWNYTLSGGIFVGYWAIGLFFFNFKQRTGDRFFAFFGWAFWLLAAERLLLVLIGPREEVRPYVYIIRLIAFLMIAYAIFDKNRSSSRPENHPQG